MLLIAVACGCLAQGGPSGTPGASSAFNMSSFGPVRLFGGVAYTHLTVEAPRPNSIHVVDVDLSGNVSFLVTPRNRSEGYRSSETRLETTFDFLSGHRVQVAVNANPYLDLNGGAYVSGDPADVVGLSASAGDEYSQADGGPALVIGRDGRARIIDGNAGMLPAYNAVGGFSRVLRDGLKTPCGQARCVAAHPRTLVGLSADGGRLLLVIVDGRRPGVSEGLTIAECADLLLGLGARDAIELDGGGSSTLVVSDPVPRVVNVPVGLDNRPGSMRPVGSNLGVLAGPA